MKYLDSGERDASQTLATILGSIDNPTALRVQSGFFSAGSLPYLKDVIIGLTSLAAPLHIVVGSNDGSTTRQAIEALLDMVGPPRTDLRVAIVRFADGDFFHPKTLHLERSDGSVAAYVGSANFTRKGVSSHVEAGVWLDSGDGDPVDAINAVRNATDSWFVAPRDGVHLVGQESDLDSLVSTRIIGVPRPTRSEGATGSTPGLTPRLTALTLSPSVPLGIVQLWSKVLDQSNAQRKPNGNNRGSITLTKSGYPIDSQTWFREDFFGDADWVAGLTRTGKPIDTAVIPMHVSIDGVEHGILNLVVSDSPNRRQGERNNATTFLHVGDLTPAFEQIDLTGRTLTITRRTDDSFSLTIE